MDSLGGGVEVDGGGADSVEGAGLLAGAGEDVVVEPLPSCIHQPPLSLIQ